MANDKGQKRSKKDGDGKSLSKRQKSNSEQTSSNNDNNNNNKPIEAKNVSVTPVRVLQKDPNKPMEWKSGVIRNTLSYEFLFKDENGNDMKRWIMGVQAKQLELLKKLVLEFEGVNDIDEIKGLNPRKAHTTKKDDTINTTVASEGNISVQKDAKGEGEQNLLEHRVETSNGATETEDTTYRSPRSDYGSEDQREELRTTVTKNMDISVTDAHDNQPTPSPSNQQQNTPISPVTSPNVIGSPISMFMLKQITPNKKSPSIQSLVHPHTPPSPMDTSVIPSDNPSRIPIHKTPSILNFEEEETDPQAKERKYKFEIEKLQKDIEDQKNDIRTLKDDIKSKEDKNSNLERKLKEIITEKNKEINQVKIANEKSKENLDALRNQITLANEKYAKLLNSFNEQITRVKETCIAEQQSQIDAHKKTIDAQAKMLGFMTTLLSNDRVFGAFKNCRESLATMHQMVYGLEYIIGTQIQYNASHSGQNIQNDVPLNGTDQGHGGIHLGPELVNNLMDPEFPIPGTNISLTNPSNVSMSLIPTPEEIQMADQMFQRQQTV